MTRLLHANLVAYRRDGRWRGLLLRGASGAGKSDLSLRLGGARPRRSAA
jgi:serine kinase of HPr protein (carbohydrate metabolism regulator)